jgi:hypothetical protein
MPPEVMPLCVGIVAVRMGDAKNLLHNHGIIEGGRTEFRPIPTFASIDHIVDRRKCIFLMVKMAVQHWFTFGTRVATDENIP